MKRWLLLITILFSTFASATDWDALAHRDMNTSSGKAYEQAAAKFSAQQLSIIMGHCMSTEMPAEFILYFKILDTGVVTEKFSTATTPLASCFSKKMAALIWPKPPTSPFVFKINMFGSM